MTGEITSKRNAGWWGPVLGLMAFLLYFATLSDGAHPGASAQLIVRHMGLFPQLVPSHPLWAEFVRLLSLGPAGNIVFRLNIFSALCGAVSVWLLYEVVRGTVDGLVDAEETDPRIAFPASLAAGTGAAVFMMINVPFWMVSNRAHTDSFDAMLLLFLVWLFQFYWRRGRGGVPFLFAFLYGLVTTEYAALIVLAPLFGFFLLLFMWQQKQLNIPRVLGLVACGVAGLSLYFLTAWRFYGSEGYVLMDYPGYFNIVWVLWREQYMVINRSLPRVGWLLVILFTIVPWLIVLMVMKRALNTEKDWGFYILHVILTALSVAILLNLEFVDWRFLCSHSLLITPYVLAACVFGYVVAYWFLFPACIRNDESVPGFRWGRSVFRFFVLASGAALLVAAGIRNLPDADARPAGLVNWYAREVLKSATGRRWLITDGVVDNHIRIAAWEEGLPLRLLNVYGGRSDLYMRYVASHFETSRLKNAARIGMLNLLHEWFQEDPVIEQNVAILSAPDVWVGAGIQYVPNRLVFLGIRQPAGLDTMALLSEHESFWGGLETVVDSYPSLNPAQDEFREYVLRQTGFVANNLGVLLEDLGDSQTAFFAYRRSYDMDTNNVSALLNMSAMIESGKASDDAEFVKKRLEDVVANLPQRYHVWSLARRFGYVRTPQAFAQLGWTWALSGQPGLAVSGMKKAMELLPESGRMVIKARLADMYLGQKEEEAGEMLYRELLVEDPSNPRALLGLSRLASGKGDFVQARELLERAEKSGLTRGVAALEWANLHLAAGNPGQARVLLHEVTELEPDRLNAWVLLAEVLMRQNEQIALEDCLRNLNTIRGGKFFVSLIRAEQAWKTRDWNSARVFLREALASQPNNPKLIEQALRLDVIQNQMDLAEKRVVELLQVDSRNGFGYYVLGSLQVNRGQLELAEDSYRRSLEIEPTPKALNDLAWILQARGAYEEAEPLVRDALRSRGRMSEAWDTLGVILMKTRRLDEAEEALERSMSLNQNDLRVFLHMAELQVLKGQRQRAREIVEMLSTRQSQLSPTDIKQLDAVRQMIEQTSSSPLEP